LAMQNKLDGQQAPPPHEVDPEGQVLA